MVCIFPSQLLPILIKFLVDQVLDRFFLSNLEGKLNDIKGLLSYLISFKFKIKINIERNLFL